MQHCRQACSKHQWYHPCLFVTRKHKQRERNWSGTKTRIVSDAVSPSEPGPQHPRPRTLTIRPTQCSLPHICFFIFIFFPEKKKKGGITIGILRLSHLVAHTILSCRQRASHLQNNTSLAFSCLVNAPLLCCKTDILKKCLLGKKSVITLEYVSHSLERRSKIQTSGRTKPCVRRCLASLRL